MRGVSRRHQKRSRAVFSCRYAPPIVAPSPFISAVNPGKLVAIGAASSMRTGVRVARPRTRKAIAIR